MCMSIIAVQLNRGRFVHDQNDLLVVDAQPQNAANYC
jgi:hypothetical protein